jgi:hypothetical protein
LLGENWDRLFHFRPLTPAKRPTPTVCRALEQRSVCQVTIWPKKIHAYAIPRCNQD